MDAEPVFGDEVEKSGLCDHGARNRDRGAHRTDPWNEQEAKKKIDGEGAGVNGGAKALLAHHVEEPLDRANRGTRHQPDREHEHPRIAMIEAGAEKIEQRFAEDEKASG